MEKVKRRLVLYKGKERFVYVYDFGSEEMVLSAILEQWECPETSIDDLDVIIMMLKLKEPFTG